MTDFKPLDVVRTPNGYIAVVNEVSPPHNGHPIAYSIRYFGAPGTEITAWWHTENLEYIGNIADVLARGLAHPMSSTRSHAGSYYGNKDQVD